MIYFPIRIPWNHIEENELNKLPIKVHNSALKVKEWSLVKIERVWKRYKSFTKNEICQVELIPNAKDQAALDGCWN